LTMLIRNILFSSATLSTVGSMAMNANMFCILYDTKPPSFVPSRCRARRRTPSPHQREQFVAVQFFLLRIAWFHRTRCRNCPLPTRARVPATVDSEPFRNRQCASLRMI
jgi:hypothetical protein